MCSWRCWTGEAWARRSSCWQDSATRRTSSTTSRRCYPRYRVLGITRRGHGRSSAAPAGYGFARLADDIARVIDLKGVSRPVVIGHSFAGEELHELGARYAEKIAGLVYIDAAFNRGDDSD